MEVFELIIDGIGKGIEWLQIVKLGSVSLWQIVCGTFILSSLIVGLVNVVQIGSINWGFGEHDRRVREKRKAEARAKRAESRKGK